LAHWARATTSTSRPPDAGVPGGEAVIVDQVAPDHHGVAAAGHGTLDQLPVGHAGTGGRGALGARLPDRRAGLRRRGGQPRVGGHPYGRFCRRVAPAPRGPHGEPGGLEVGAGRLAPHAGRRFDVAQRPAQAAQGNDLLFRRVAQDVGHAAQGALLPPPRQRPERLPAMAGFQLSMYGRFWASTEVKRPQQPAGRYAMAAFTRCSRAARAPRSGTPSSIPDLSQR